MKAEELRALDADELTNRLKGARRELYELRFKLAVGQLDDHRQIRNARRDIARILTVVHQRRLGIPVPEAAAAVEAPELVSVVAAPGQEVPPTPTLPHEGGGGGPEETSPESEETPENVEAVAEAPAEEPPPPKRTRRRKAADEESG